MYFKIMYFILLFSYTSISYSQNTDILVNENNTSNDLPGYPFKSNFIEIENGILMHYLDEGKKENPVILLLHGVPSWSYIYRNIIPVLTKNGYRVIAPDLIGFGKSDKFNSNAPYTYSNQTRWVDHFIKKMDLKDINLFAHDWGGMIGLRIVAEKPDLFSSVMISYAFLFTGEEIIPDSFNNWKNYAQNEASLQAGQVMDWGTAKNLPQEIKDAYNLPFPDQKHMLGLRKLPSLVPVDPNDKEAVANKKLREKLKSFKKPFLTIWGNNDDLMWAGKDKILQKEIPGAQNQNHKILDANHFIQEDQPEQIAQIIMSFVSK